LGGVWWANLQQCFSPVPPSKQPKKHVFPKNRWIVALMRRSNSSIRSAGCRRGAFWVFGPVLGVGLGKRRGDAVNTTFQNKQGEKRKKS